ncbi:MAG: LysR family transcriptional regulator [Bacteriovoracaceae bacterium]
MSILETSQLQTIQTVASAKSFSRAAEELGVTQSAVSQSIKNIERKLGMSLFRRSGKQVLLTEEGEKIEKLARDFFKSLEKTLQEVKEERDQMVGRIRLGTLTGVGKSWLAPILLDFMGLHPNVEIDLKLGFQEDLTRDFENGKIDFLVLPEEHLPLNGEKKFLGEEKITLILPESFKTFSESELTLEKVLEYPMILFEAEDRLFSKWCESLFQRKPKNIKRKLVVNSHGHILRAVQQGIGAAVLPLHVVTRSHYLDSLVVLDEKYQISNGSFYLVYHKTALRLRRMQEMIDYIGDTKNPLGR